MPFRATVFAWVVFQLDPRWAPIVEKKEPERRGHDERERAYNGSAGSRGRAPGRGVRGRSPPEAESL